MDIKRIIDNKLPDGIDSLEKVYDEIRMRDEDGHPLTYIDYGKLRMEFRHASLRRNHVEADVRITINET